MAETLRGKLIIQKTRKGPRALVVFPTRKGDSLPTPFDPRDLAASLQGRTEPMIEVDLELDNGRPVRIRPPDEPWQAPPPPSPPSPPPPMTDRQHRPSPAASGFSARSRSQPTTAVSGPFHNPYNFIRALPREGVQGELGDRRPDGHALYRGDRHSGRISIRIEVVTPLLIPDATRASEQRAGPEQGHRSYPLRMNNGLPYLPPTSLKGALRAAFEAVTNSRLGVFRGHDQPLARRMATQEGLELMPVRVEPHDQLALCPGNTDDAVRAAWLLRYERSGGISPRALRYPPGDPQGDPPAHGDAVRCWLEKFQHWRWDYKQRAHVPDFMYWRVRSIARANDPAPPPRPAPSPPSRPHPGTSRHEPLGAAPIEVDGWVCITNQNINRKYNERVFFVRRGVTPPTAPLTPALREGWRTLIRNYQDLHQKELKRRRERGLKCDAYLGPTPGQTGFSRHICTSDALELKPGDLCYARRDGAGVVVALYPVTIGRELFAVTPQDLLPQSLHPPRAIGELSPADRLFGWVNQRGQGAYKGQLRIGPTTCTPPADGRGAVQSFGEPGLPLAILGQPKPQQARFYVAEDRDGGAQPPGLDRDRAGYWPDKGLRGRKVYPHHAGLPAGYWDGGAGEYRRPAKDGAEQRDDQNRSIQAWVRPGTVFRCTLDLLNLSAVELGALAWLLSLPAGHHHRLGGGKPLGFGSVRIAIEEVDLATGPALAERYRWLVPPDPAAVAGATTGAAIAAAIRSPIETFQQAVRAAYGGGAFEAIPFIAGFLTAARGFADGKPLHYPRAGPRDHDERHDAPPDPAGENFAWFVENERGRERRVALADLVGDPGLPVWPKRR